MALLERNQRPVTADMLLRLARTYKVDLADLAGDGGADTTSRMQAVLKEPMFADIDIPPLEISDIAIGYPGLAEAISAALHRLSRGAACAGGSPRCRD